MSRGQKLKNSSRHRGLTSSIAIVTAGIVFGSMIIMSKALSAEAIPNVMMDLREASVTEHVVSAAVSVRDTANEAVITQQDVVEVSELNLELLESVEPVKPMEPSELSVMMDAGYYASLSDASKRLVLVDLSEQQVWAFENEQVILESPVVTGLKDRYDTQVGKYAVILKRQDYTMRGSYGRVRVNYWMRFNDPYAQGLHDASWRSEFGGGVYMTNGSHGCVNLPLDFTAELYNFVDIGTPVIVQE